MPKCNVRLERGNAGILFVFFVAVVIVVITLLPAEYTPIQQSECIVGSPPTKKEILRLSAIKNEFDAPRLGQPSDLSIGGPDPNEKADFQLIRSNVPTMKESIPGPGDQWPSGWLFLGGKQKSPVEHMINTDEVPEKPGYDLYYPSEWGEMDLLSGKRIYMRGEGIIIFVNKDPSLVKEANGGHIYLTEIYQDVRVLNNPDRGYKTEDLFFCKENQSLQSPHLETPAQNVSANREQLQLEWFFLGSNNYWAVHCKPAIYLYPRQKELVNVKVYPAQGGTLKYTDPLYDQTIGWNVEANPDGNLVNLGSSNFMKNYNYLYFESRVPDQVIKKPEQGWVIKSEQFTGGSLQWFAPLEDQFNQILPQLGLNAQQTKDFIDYWQKALPYSPYYFIGVIDQDNVDQIEKLAITPKPDQVNRVRIYFERLDHPKEVETPDLKNISKSKILNSKLFNVVEWGGMVKNDPNHPFTCSQ